MTTHRVEEAIRVERPVADVFAAWSTAEHLATWFAPMAIRRPDVQLAFEAGGAYRIDMDLGEGRVHRTEGRFLEIVPEARIRMTWHCDAWDDPPSVVEIDFAPDGAGTVVRVRHTRITTEPAREGQEFGWTACLAALRQNLEHAAQPEHER